MLVGLADGARAERDQRTQRGDQDGQEQAEGGHDGQPGGGVEDEAGGLVAAKVGHHAADQGAGHGDAPGVQHRGGDLARQDGAVAQARGQQGLQGVALAFSSEPVGDNAHDQEQRQPGKADQADGVGDPGAPAGNGHVDAQQTDHDDDVQPTGPARTALVDDLLKFFAYDGKNVL